MSKTLKNIGNIIRCRRAFNNTSQMQLEIKTGISTQVISRLEKGESVGSKSLVDILDALGGTVTITF